MASRQLRRSTRFLTALTRTPKTRNRRTIRFEPKRLKARRIRERPIKLQRPTQGCKDADLLARLLGIAEQARGRFEEAETNAEGGAALDRTTCPQPLGSRPSPEIAAQTDKAEEHFVWFVRQSQRVLVDPDQLRLARLGQLSRAGPTSHRSVSGPITNYFQRGPRRTILLAGAITKRAGRVFIYSRDKQHAIRASKGTEHINPTRRRSSRLPG